MNNIKHWIPTYCELGGQEIQTVIDADKTNSQTLGYSVPTNGTINICKTVQGIKQTHSISQNTYFHELVHLILQTIGEMELNDNEKFVQNFGTVMFEFFRTAKWCRIEEFEHNVFSEPVKIPPFVGVNKCISSNEYITEFKLSDDTNVKINITTDKIMNRGLLKECLKENMKTILEGLVDSIND